MDHLSTDVGTLGRATALYPLISGEAEAAERLGRLTDPVADALLHTGLLSILVPETHGGLGGGRLDFFDAVEEIARADGSAGWCASVCNAINHTAFLGLPAEGREELFGDGPVACWTALAPNAAATPEAGGYRVSCAGAFGSGSSLSRWVLVAGNTGGPGEGRYRAFLVPKVEAQIKAGSWDVMGLRATASIDYVISDRFVPARRTWEYAWSAKAGGGPLSAIDAARLNAVGLAGFAAGVARRALSELIVSAKKTRRTVSEGFMADDPVVQLGVGELDGRLRAARSHLASLVRAMDERAAAGRDAGFEDGLAVSQACLTLARASREMVIFAFDYAGTSAIYARQPLQRCLRDIFTGLKHASFTPALLGRIGKVQLGLPFGGAPL